MRAGLDGVSPDAPANRTVSFFVAGGSTVGASVDGEGDGFAVLHVYTCAALLIRWSEDLRKMEFHEMVIFLQHLPTSGWSNKEVGELLSQAYVFKSLYHNSPSHLGAA